MIDMKVCAFFFLFLLVPAFATDYFVATNGDDEGLGTEGDPWRTISKAADTMIAGDTVYIKEGTYNERIIPHNSGNPSEYITYMAYPGDTVTVDGNDIYMNWAGLVHIVDMNYIRISGLRIMHSQSFCVYINTGSSSGTHHVIIEDNYIYNCSRSGIKTNGKRPNRQVKNVILENNEVRNTCISGSQECISLSYTDDFEVRNNLIYECGDCGIDAKGESSNGKIYNNHVYDCYSANSAVGVYVDHGTNIEIFNNTIHDTKGCGIAASLEDYDSPNVLENITVYNNLVYRTGGGFCHWTENHDEPATRKNILVINNVFHENTNCGFRISTGLTFDNFTIRNNIITDNTNQQLLIGEGVAQIDHNVIQGYTQVTGEDAIIADPLFVDADAGDFHLQENSPAIDNGSSIYAPNVDFDGVGRPQGTTYDIGAFESSYSVEQDVYYVSSSGDDNHPGTLAFPWRTIQKAADSVSAGNTVYIRGGTYNEKVDITTSGTSGNTITFSSYPGETALIDGTGISLPWTGLIHINTAKYLTIKNLVIQNSERWGISTAFEGGASPSSHITVYNCSFENIYRNAVWFWQEDIDQALMNHINVSHCSFNEIQTSLSSGECATFVGNNNSVFEYNTMTNIHKIGVDFASGSTNCLIDNNDIDVTGMETNAFGIYIDGGQKDGQSCHNITVSNDYVHGSRQGIGFCSEIGANSYIKNLTIVNNVVDVADYVGIACFHNYGVLNHYYDVTIKHNTIYSHGSGGSALRLAIYDDYVHDFIVANNIFVSGDSTNYQLYTRFLSTNPELIRANNLYYHTSKAANTRFEDGTGMFEPSAKITDPLLENLGTDFHLTDLSPAKEGASSEYTISTDFEGNSRPQGNAFDIGAFEYVQTGPDTLPPETFIDSGPSGDISTDNVTFVWHGTDDTTPQANLEYNYSLDGVWSGW
ncbi:right-handed parallel beta-helix repeat-containing protein, partial [archaeon]|nr:right-handed parallel beta-helix repeat-containing protein [archaeon]